MYGILRIWIWIRNTGYYYLENSSAKSLKSVGPGGEQETYSILNADRASNLALLTPT